MGEGITYILGIKIYTLLYMKQITNKSLLYSVGNSTQYLTISYNGRECKQRIYIYIHKHTYIHIYICVCVCMLNHFGVHQKHDIVYQLYFNEIFFE